MTSIDDIKQVLRTYTLGDLTDEYEDRTYANIRMNRLAIKSFADSLNMDLSSFNYDNKDVLIKNIIAFMNSTSNESIRNFIYQQLINHKYKTNIEIASIMNIIDNYRGSNVDYLDFLCQVHSFLTIRGLKEENGEYTIETDNGTYKLSSAYEALGISEPLKENRNNQCHHVTSWALLENPNLYGGYFSMPLEFAGRFDHSIVIDPEKNMVYDLALNLCIPFEAYKQYGLDYIFLIRGSEFQELSQQVYDYTGDELFMHHLEEIRRIRNK